MGTILVPHYLQMPPCVKNGDIIGTTLTANAAMRKDGDSTGITISGNAAVSEKQGQYWYDVIQKCRHQ
jgi:hypothetical protein